MGWYTTLLVSNKFIKKKRFMPRNKYQKVIQEYSVDGGLNWFPVVPENSRRGRLIEEASDDCNIIDWRVVVGSWFCVEFQEDYRWIDTGEYDCAVGDKYTYEKEQMSIDGINWTDTGYTRPSGVIRNSGDCPIDYPNEYLTIEIMSDEASVYSGYSGLEYKIDNGTWKSYNGEEITGTLYTKIQWRGHLSSVSGSMFTATDNVRVFGNINSVFDYDTFTDNSYKCLRFFENFTKLIDAENLILPATTLVESAYKCMFNGCTGLVTPPELPATTVSIDCYSQMFKGCASLTTAPALPAMTMAQGCYYEMFGNCTSLVTPPALPATTLAEGCYFEMFANCQSLATAPALPAMSIPTDAYEYMFQNCISITTAPELLSTDLSDHCYKGMFWHCTSLVNVQETLPATQLRAYCYHEMFRECTSLVTAPELPAISLEDDRNWRGCAEYCYADMFRGCTSLNYIKMSVESIPEGLLLREFTSDWVISVAPVGLFVKNSNATWVNVYGNSGIPSTWSIEYDSNLRWVVIPDDYLCNGRNKYRKEKEQISNDDGETWTDTGRTRRGTLIEADCVDCSKWVIVPDVPYVSALGFVFRKMKEQLTYDNGETWEDTGNTRYMMDKNTPVLYNNFKNQYLTVEVNDHMTELMFRRGTSTTDGQYDFINLMSRGVNIGENGAIYSDWESGMPVLEDYQFVQFKAEGYSSSIQRPNLQSDVPFMAFGNVHSLFAGDNFASDTTTTSVTRLFYQSNIEDAKYIYTENSSSCEEWFYYCENLVYAPQYIYNASYFKSMFQHCSNLRFGPVFDIEEVGYKGFVATFYDCVSLMQLSINAIYGNYLYSNQDVENMFGNVNTRGVIIVPSNSIFVTNTYYASAIPSTWTVVTTQ